MEYFIIKIKLCLFIILYLGRKKGYPWKKQHLTSSDISNCLNDILVLHIAGSKAENCSALFSIVSKIRLIMVSEQERKSLLSCPTEAFGILHLVHCDQNYGTKTFQIIKNKGKFFYSPWIWNYISELGQQRKKQWGELELFKTSIF